MSLKYGTHISWGIMRELDKTRIRKIIIFASLGHYGAPWVALEGPGVASVSVFALVSRLFEFGLLVFPRLGTRDSWGIQH